MHLSVDCNGNQTPSGSDRLRALARHLGRLAAAEAMRVSVLPAPIPTLENTDECHG